MQAKTHNSFLNFALLFVVILASRLPFLSAGYGVEEDSWGMINALQRMHDTGVFEVSRFPGHPVVEFVYLHLLGNNYFLFNFCTALISTIGFLFFAAALSELGFKKYFWSTLALAFIPVVYIKCTDTMDFMWGLSFMLMSFYLVAKQNFWLSGVALGLAIGARFTEILFLLPLTLLFFDFKDRKSYSNLLILTVTTISVTLLCFAEVIKNYNPAVYIVPYMIGYPDAIKTLYKASIGVFGLIGCVALAFVILKIIFSKTSNSIPIAIGTQTLNLKLQTLNFNPFLISGFVIYTLLFIWQPHKSAYLIPSLPFLILLIAYYSNEKYSIGLAASMIASTFLLGINLEDDYRGSAPSLFSKTIEVSSQKISIDLLKGPLAADQSRRRQKIIFVEGFVSQCRTITKPTVVLVGWYLSEVEVITGKNKNQNVHCFYFLTEDELKKYEQQGYEIFYLPQQEQVNDLRWQKTFTKKYAKPMYNDEGQKLIF